MRALEQAHAANDRCVGEVPLRLEQPINRTAIDAPCFLLPMLRRLR